MQELFNLIRFLVGAPSSVGGTTGSTLDATITLARALELRTLSIDILAGNFGRKPALRMYTGKTQSMASVLITWRPFVHMLCGAVMSHNAVT